MQSTQLSFDLVTGYDVRWIGLGALDCDLYPVRRRKREIAFDDWTGKIVEFFECVCSTVIEIGRPMPRGMTTGTRGAECEELRVWCPRLRLYVASIFSLG